MLLWGSIALAHHGTTATYQLDKAVAISGKVTEFDFVYPHPQLYLDVKAADGTIQKWGAEWTPHAGNAPKSRCRLEPQCD
jgi:hypothetical protein